VSVTANVIVNVTAGVKTRSASLKLPPILSAKNIFYECDINHPKIDK